MDVRFDGKRALVTGAGKGLGYAIAKALAAGGAETTALSRTQDDLDQLKAEDVLSKVNPPELVLSYHNSGIHTVCVDLADWVATKSAVEEIGPIDLLVNNAGIFKTSPFLDVTEAEVNELFDVNVKASINVAQVVAKGMVNQGNGGAIVNVSSISSCVAKQNQTSYCASKGAFDQVTRVMALELGPHQIRVNSVLPTRVLTAIGCMSASDADRITALLSRTPQGKCAEVEDIVHAVLYLLSDKADMINGITLHVDGGYSVA